MSLTYFGPGVDASGNLTISPGFTSNQLSFLSQITFTAPASGNWADLSVWAVYVAGAQANVRLAVFRASDGRREAQGNSAVAISGASPSWQGHMAPAQITQYNAAVNGTAYKFGIGADTNLLGLYYDTGGSSGDYNYQAVDQSGSWPDPAPGGYSNASVRLVMRVGISVGGAIAVPQIVNSYRQRQNS